MNTKYNDVINDLVEVLQEAGKKESVPLDIQAKVIRVDNDVIWVHLPGGVDETPVRKTINAKQGDIVQVKISNGDAWITGNATAPPTDDTKAEAAQNTAQKADNKAVTAGKTATDAKIIAEAINQFFWHDTNGAHVTEVTKEDWLANPSGNNILMNALGILIRSGLITSASFSAGGVTFYALDGVTEIARFNSDGAMIGNQTGRRIELSEENTTIYDVNSQKIFGIDVITIDESVLQQNNRLVYDNDGSAVFEYVLEILNTPKATSEIKLSCTSILYIQSNRAHRLRPQGYSDTVTFTAGTADEITETGHMQYQNIPYTATYAYDGNNTITITIDMSVVTSTTMNQYLRGVVIDATVKYTAVNISVPKIQLGVGTIAPSNGLALGNYNVEDVNDDYFLIIGNGSSDNNRSNVLTIAKNGIVDFLKPTYFDDYVYVNNGANIIGAVHLHDNVDFNDDIEVNGDINSRGYVRIANSIKRKTYTWTIASIGANEYTSTEVDPPTESGYTPISIAGWGIDGTGTSHVKWVKCHINSNGKLVIGLMNDNSNARTNWTATVYILYVKS